MSSEVDRAMDDYLASFERDARDPVEIGTHLAEEILVTDWMNPQHDLVGKEEVIRVFYLPIVDSFPDVRFEVHDSLRDGDRLLICGFFTGTMLKDYWGFPAHGRRVRWEARDLYRFMGGQIDRIWFANDTLTVARQLGADINDQRLW